jgi:hypothetical protein
VGFAGTEVFIDTAVIDIAAATEEIADIIMVGRSSVESLLVQ